MLAMVTGYVDAVAYLHLFAVFVANQSGNTILFGIGVGQADWDAVWRPALAMAGFVGGVGAGLLFARRLPERDRPAALLGAEAVALIGLAAAAGDLAGRTAPLAGARGVVLLALAAFAMGIQTDVIRRVARVSVATTYQSGTLVRIADELAGAVAREALSPAVRRALFVLGGVVAAYVAGAAIGTAVVDGWGGALWLPPLAAGGVAAWMLWSPLPAGTERADS